MTNLEIILIIIIWVSYGMFCISNTDIDDANEIGQIIFKIAAIMFSPIFLIYRIGVGIFKSYKL